MVQNPVMEVPKQKCLKIADLRAALLALRAALLPLVIRFASPKTHSCWLPEWLRPQRLTHESEKADDIEIDSRTSIY